MEDDKKSKEQLLEELDFLRKRLSKQRETPEQEPGLARDTQRVAEEKYRTLFDSAGDAMFIHDAEGRILAVNPMVRKQYGYTQPELMAMTVAMIDSVEHSIFVPARMRRLIETGSIQFETQHQRKDGAIITVDVNARTIIWEDKPAIMSICRDISERKLMEQELREARLRLEERVQERTAELSLANEALRMEVSERKLTSESLLMSETKFRHYMESCPLAIFVADQEGRIIDCNFSSVELLDYSVPTLESSSLFDFLLDDDREGVRRDLATLYEVGYIEGEYRFRKMGGEIIWVSVLAVILSDLISLYYCRDVTEHKLAEQALRENEERFRTLSEAALEGLAFTEKGVLIDANQQLAQMLGYETCEIIGRGVDEFTAPEDRELVRRNILGSYELPYENHLMRKDGTKMTVESRARHFSYQGRNVRVTALRDITERKKMEDTLRMERENLVETNAALKVLLRQREEDRRELEEALLINVKNLLMPYVEKLMNKKLRSDQETLVRIIESHLREITSPFLQRLSHQYLNLTPTEIRIADLVRDGRTTKEIAAILGASEKSVNFHRNNLRGKLGLTKKKMNLRTYLSSLR